MRRAISVRQEVADQELQSLHITRIDLYFDSTKYNDEVFKKSVTSIKAFTLVKKV